jgi:hypothetical protein
MPQQLKARDFLLDPQFHGLDREVKRSLLNDVWPEFAQSPKIDQEATLDQTMEQWDKIINPPAPPAKSRLDKAFDWFKGGGLPAGTLTGLPRPEDEGAPVSKLEPPPGAEIAVTGQPTKQEVLPAPETGEPKKKDLTVAGYLGRLMDPTRGLGVVNIPTGTAAGTLTLPSGLAEKLPIAGQIVSAVKWADIIRAASRVRDGRAKDSDWAVIERFKKELDSDAETQNTWATNVAQVLVEMPAFAAEIGLTGGAYTAGKTLVNKALGGLAERGVKRFAQRAAGAAVGSAIQTAAIPTRILATGLENVVQRGAMPAAEAAGAAGPIGSRGWRTAFKDEIDDTDDDYVTAFAQAAPAVYAEVFSEHAGGALEGLGGTKLGKKFLGLSAVQKISALKAAVMNRWLNSPNKSAVDLMEKLKSAVAWNGVLGEMFEERVADIQHYVQQGMGLESDIGQENPAIVKLVTGEGGRTEAIKEFMYQLSVEAAAFSVPGATMDVVGRLGKRAEEEQRSGGPRPSDRAPATPIVTVGERGITLYEPEATVAQPEGMPEAPERFKPIEVDIRAPEAPKQLGPAPGTYLAAGGTVGAQPELNLGTEGGLEAPRNAMATLMGPTEGVVPLADEAQAEDEAPITKGDYDAIMQQIALIESGDLKMPVIQAAQKKANPETIRQLVNMAMQRGDFAWMHDVRKRLGVGPEVLMPSMAQPTILEPGVTKEGLDRLQMFRDRKLQRLQGRTALPAPPEMGEAVQLGMDRARMAAEGKVGEPVKKATGLLPPPDYSFEEAAPGALVEKKARRRKIVPAQATFGFKSETGAAEKRLAPPPGSITEGLEEDDFMGYANRLSQVRIDREAAIKKAQEDYERNRSEIDAGQQRRYAELRKQREAEDELLDKPFEELEKTTRIARNAAEEAAYNKFADAVKPLLSESMQRQFERDLQGYTDTDLGRQRRLAMDPMENSIRNRDTARAAFVIIRRMTSYGEISRETAETIRPLKEQMERELEAAQSAEGEAQMPMYNEIVQKKEGITERYQKLYDDLDAEVEKLEKENLATKEGAVAGITAETDAAEKALVGKMRLAPMWYSRLEKGVQESQQNVLTPEQAEALMKKNASQDEIDYVGVQDFINEKKVKGEKITKQELLDRIAEGKLTTHEVMFGETQYSQYSEPGYDQPQAEYGELVVGEDIDASKLTGIEKNLSEVGAVELMDRTFLVLDPSDKLRKADIENNSRTWGAARRARKAVVERINKLIQGQKTTLKSQMRLAFQGTAIKENVQTVRISRTGTVMQVFHSPGEAIADLLATDTNMLADWKDGHPAYDGVTNPLVRLRFTTRYTEDGKKVLFLEEIQAPHGDPEFWVEDEQFDYAAEAKEFARQQTEIVKENMGDKFDPKVDTIKMVRKFGGEFAKMPKWAQKRWLEIGLKRAVRYAAERGFDSVSWTTGAMQVGRYSLIKKIDRLTYDPITTDLRAWRGERPYFDQKIKEERLSAYVGPEIARKLMRQGEKYRQTKSVDDLPTLQGEEDLRIQMSGLMEIYDEMLPTTLVQIAKKFGTQIEIKDIKFPNSRYSITPNRSRSWGGRNDGFSIYDEPESEYLKDDQGQSLFFATEAEAQKYINSRYTNLKSVQTFPISRELRASAARTGFALMKETGLQRVSKDTKQTAGQAEKQGIEEKVGLPAVEPPVKMVKAYKLFRVDPNQPGRLFSLFVNANDSIGMGEWVDAVIGPEAKAGKVKSKLGPLAMRPGWHSGDAPAMTHIGGVSSGVAGAPPDFRPENQVWAEVEIPADVDWQREANARGRNAQGRIVPVRAAITDQVPKGGHYRYKTNPNMRGDWFISGAIKVNRILGDQEVAEINKKAGVRDLPRKKGYKPVSWIAELESPPGAERATIEPPPTVRYGLPDVALQPAPNADAFVDARSASQRGAYLGTQSAAELEAEAVRLYMTDHKLVGYGITQDGELINLYNNGGPKGAGSAAVIDAVKRGAYWLSCFDGTLPVIYTKAGFEVVARIPFDEEVAPAGWETDLPDKPDLLFMAWKGTNYGRAEEQYDSTRRYVPGTGRQAGGYDEGKALARAAASPGWDVAVRDEGARRESTEPGPGTVYGQVRPVREGVEGVWGVLTPSEQSQLNVERAAEAEEIRSSGETGRNAPSPESVAAGSLYGPGAGAEGRVRLEGAVPVGLEGPPEMAGASAATGGRGPEQGLTPPPPEALRASRVVERKLAPGQTLAGRKAADGINTSPLMHAAGRPMRVIDASGEVDRKLMKWVADHPAVRGIMEHADFIFERLREVLVHTESDNAREYQTTKLDGATLDADCYAVFYPGDELNGRGAPNLVYFNPVAGYERALKLIQEGVSLPQDATRIMANGMVDSLLHEMIHTVERNESADGHRKVMLDFYEKYGDVTDKLVEHTIKFLENSDYDYMGAIHEIHADWVATIRPFYQPGSFAGDAVELYKKTDIITPTEEHLEKVRDMIVKEDLTSMEKARPKFREVFSGIRNADFEEIWRQGVARAAQLINGLTPAEMERVGKTARTVKNISDNIEAMPPDTDLMTLAKMGEAKRGWYYRAVRAVRALADMVDPADRVVLVRLIAASSPRQSVKLNLVMAIDAYAEWVRRGRPTDKANLEEWVPTFVPMDSRWQNAIAAFRGESFSDKSFKVSSFSDNMLDDVLRNVEAVTNDIHMSKLFPEWLKLGTMSGYYAGAAKVRRVAKQLGWQPREVQETIWSTMKTLYEIAESKGETRNISEVFQTITEEDIIQHGTEFSVLLTSDKDVYDAIVKLGVNPKALRAKIEEYGGAYQPPPARRFEEVRTSLSGGLAGRLNWNLEESKRKIREAAERRATAKELTAKYTAEGHSLEEVKEMVLTDLQALYPDAYKRGERLIPLEEGAEGYTPITEEEEQAEQELLAKQQEGLEPPPGAEDFGFKATTGAAVTRLVPPPVPSTTPDLDDARKVFEKLPEPTPPTMKERVVQAAHEMERRWITEFAPVSHLETKVREAAGAPKKSYMENMATWMEAVYGAPAMAERDLIDFEDVVEPIKGNLKDFDTFLFLRRTQDRIQEDPQKRRVGKWDLPKVQRAFAQMRAEIGNNMVDEFYRVADHYVNNGVFVEGPFQKTMDAALQLQVSSGRLSNKIYNVIKGMNDFYAPFKVLQYLDPSSETKPGEGVGRKIATRADLTHAIKGIDNPDFRIDSILAESARQIYRSRILAEKNKAMLKFAELAPLDPSGENIRLVHGPVYLPPGAPGEDGRWILPSGEGVPKDKAVLPFKKDGENVALIVPKDVGVAVQGLNGMQTGIMSTALRRIMAPARWGATTFNLAFQPVNYLFADMPRLATMSKYGVRNLKDAFMFFGDFMSGTVSAFRGTFTNADYLYKMALEMGVLNSTIQKVLTPEIFAEKYGLEPQKKGKLHTAKHYTIDQFAKFANALEESTKVTGVKRALRLEQYDQLTGRAKEEAANRIRTELRRYSGSPDFARAGVDARMMNLWVMFINARLQGTHSDMARLLGKTGGKDAAAVWARMGAMMLPMLAVALLNRGDDDLAKDYAQVPQWEKENYFMIPLPSRFITDEGVSVRNYARIPKREIFKLFGNMVDSVVGFMADKDPPSMASVADEFLGNISPVNIQGKTAREKGESVIGNLNPIVKAPAEWIFNRDMFRHRDVVPKSLENLPGEMQYKRTTPKPYVMLGQMTGFSPLRIQQATSGISAGLITQFTWGNPTGDRGWYSELPVVKRFIRSDIVSTEAEDARLQEAISKNQTDSAIKKQLAEHLYETVKDKPRSEQMRLVAKARREAKDPLLADTLKQIIRDAGRGLTYQDRQMLRLGVKSGDRAAYIQDALARLPNEQAREEWLKDLRRKKVVTKDVLIQIRRGKRPMRRTSGGGLEPPP